MSDDQADANTEPDYGEARWWQLIPHTCVIDFERVAILIAGQHSWTYYIDLCDALGHRHRFMCKGVFWQGYDMRIYAPKPAVGGWSPAAAPGDDASEIDFDALLREPGSFGS